MRVHYIKRKRKKRKYKFKVTEDETITLPGYQNSFIISKEDIAHIPYMYSPNAKTYLAEFTSDRKNQNLLTYLSIFKKKHIKRYLAQAQWFQAMWNKVHTVERCFRLTEVPIEDVVTHLPLLKDFKLTIADAYVLWKGQKYGLRELGRLRNNNMVALATRNGVEYYIRLPEGRLMLLVSTHTSDNATVWWLRAKDQYYSNYTRLNNLQKLRNSKT